MLRRPTTAVSRNSKSKQKKTSSSPKRSVYVPAGPETRTKKTTDGKYYILEPTLTLDTGPNYKEKIYNDINLKYAYDPKTKEYLNYAECKCVVEIPHIVEPMKRAWAGLKTLVTESDAKSAAPGAKETGGGDDASQAEAASDYYPDLKDLLSGATKRSGPQEWSLPIKFIIKQRNHVVGKDFKDEIGLEVFVS